MGIELVTGDCRGVLAGMAPASFDACVTDSPYHLTTDKRGGTGVASLNVNSPADRSRISTGFMGTSWDGGDVAFRPETWAAVYRVLKPGAHLLAFGGTRTYHRLACAIEDAGFEIRDTIMWLYGSGFPKSLDVSKALDRAAGAERAVMGVDPVRAAKLVNQTGDYVTDAGWSAGHRSADITAPATEAARAWAGWGTALKPATEIVCVARKPAAAVSSAELHGLTGWDHWCSAKTDGEDKIVTARALHPAARSYRVRISKHGQEITRVDLGAYEPFAVDAVAANVLRWGTGALNIDASRINPGELVPGGGNGKASHGGRYGSGETHGERALVEPHTSGRWPANVCHNGSPEVMAAFAKFADGMHGAGHAREAIRAADGAGMFSLAGDGHRFGDTGTAARFFYTAKAGQDERLDSKHPTVKPVALMEWLVQMVTPPGGRVLDPFCGTGSTLVACDRLGFDAVGIEQDARTVKAAHEKIRRMRARRAIGAVAKVPALPGQMVLAL